MVKCVILFLFSFMLGFITKTVIDIIDRKKRYEEIKKMNKD